MEDKRLVQNSVICLGCGEKLVSYHRHDFVSCKCDNGTYVDGGSEYQRFGGKDLSLIQEDNVYFDAPFEKIREVLCRGSRGKNRDQPLTYMPLKEIDNEYLQAIINYEEDLRPNNTYLSFYKQEQQYRNGNNRQKNKE